MTPPESRDSVLRFWFGESADDAAAAKNQSALWWGKDAAADRLIGKRFGALRERAIAGALTDWEATARGRLARIILVDQFSRNMFRDDPAAFAHDGLARRWSDEGIAAGADRTLRPIERVFFYLPLQHSEALPDQERAVALYEGLLADVAAAARKSFGNFLDYARRHRDIIRRFGRFPHRNAALGRASTPAELEFLRQPGSSF